MDCSSRVEQQYNGVQLAKCTTYEELCIEVNDYMDYYNKERYQWELAKLALNQYAEYLRTGYYPNKGIAKASQL